VNKVGCFVAACGGRFRTPLAGIGETGSSSWSASWRVHHFFPPYPRKPAPEEIVGWLTRGIWPQNVLGLLLLFVGPPRRHFLKGRTVYEASIEAVRLRIHIGESDRSAGGPL
jgi:hypothetical protein